MNKYEQKAKELIEEFELHQLIKEEDINDTYLSYTVKKHNNFLNACRSAIKHIKLLRPYLSNEEVLFYTKVELLLLKELN